MADEKTDFRSTVAKLLKLDAKSTDSQILNALQQREAYEAREARIQSRIAEGGGALSREMAILALQHQDEEEARRKSQAESAKKQSTKK